MCPIDLGKHVEEYLTYIKSCMTVAPRHTLAAVQSLLRCLFRSNHPCLPVPITAATTTTNASLSGSMLACPRLQTSPSIFEAIISNPYASFTVEHGLNVEAGGGGDLMSSSSSSSGGQLLMGSSPFRSVCFTVPVRIHILKTRI